MPVDSLHILPFSLLLVLGHVTTEDLFEPRLNCKALPLCHFGLGHSSGSDCQLNSLTPVARSLYR